MEERQEQAVSPTTSEPKVYEKPVLKRIPLRPEEAVLGACKTMGTCSIATLGS